MDELLRALMEWSIATAAIMVGAGFVYHLYSRVSRKLLGSLKPQMIRPETGAREVEESYYFISIRCMEAENKLAFAEHALAEGEFTLAVKNAHDSVRSLLEHIGERVGVPTRDRKLHEMAEDIRGKGLQIQLWGLRILDSLESKGKFSRGEATRAVNIAVRFIEGAREIRVEPPQEAGGRKEGDQVPGGSRVI